jgi:hypothetical protein
MVAIVVAWCHPLEVKDVKTWMSLLSILLARIFLTDKASASLALRLRPYATCQCFVTRVSLSREDHTHTPIQQFTVSNPVLSTGRTLCTAWAYITYRPREVGLA